MIDYTINVILHGWAFYPFLAVVAIWAIGAYLVALWGCAQLARRAVVR